MFKTREKFCKGEFMTVESPFEEENTKYSSKWDLEAIVTRVNIFSDEYRGKDVWSVVVTYSDGSSEVVRRYSGRKSECPIVIEGLYGLSYDTIHRYIIHDLRVTSVG